MVFKGSGLESEILSLVDADCCAVKVLLVHSTKQHDRWCFPGGGIDRGETAEAAAKREVVGAP